MSRYIDPDRLGRIFAACDELRPRMKNPYGEWVMMPYRLGFAWKDPSGISPLAMQIGYDEAVVFFLDRVAEWLATRGWYIGFFDWDERIKWYGFEILSGEMNTCEMHMLCGVKSPDRTECYVLAVEHGLGLPAWNGSEKAQVGT